MELLVSPYRRRSSNDLTRGSGICIKYEKTGASSTNRVSPGKILDHTTLSHVSIFVINFKQVMNNDDEKYVEEKKNRLFELIFFLIYINTSILL
jgi:hypothetical protein